MDEETEATQLMSGGGRPESSRLALASPPPHSSARPMDHSVDTGPGILQDSELKYTACKIEFNLKKQRGSICDLTP